MQAAGQRSAWILIGSRKINKRTALFAEGLVRRGYTVRLIAIPRQRWDFSALEATSASKAGFTTAALGGGTQTWPSLVIVMHWVLLPFAVLFRVGGCKIFYDECDDYALTAEEGGYLSRLITPWLVTAVHRLILPITHGTFCVHMAGGVLAGKLASLGARNVVEVHNFPAERWIRRREMAVAGPLTLIYSGGLWSVKGGEVLSALMTDPRLIERNIALHVFGAGDTAQLRALTRLPRTNVHGVTETARIVAQLHTHRCVGLALYQDTPRYRLIGTNSHKIFEYLAAGAPVITSSLGEIGCYVDDGCGCIVPPGATANEIAGIVADLADDTERWLAKSRQAVRETVRHGRTWEQEWEKIGAALEHHGC